MRVGLYLNNPLSESTAVALTVAREMQRQGATIEVFAEHFSADKLDSKDWITKSTTTLYHYWLSGQSMVIYAELPKARTTNPNPKRRDYVIAAGKRMVTGYTDKLSQHHGVICPNPHVSQVCKNAGLRNTIDIPALPHWVSTPKTVVRPIEVLVPMWWGADQSTELTAINMLQALHDKTGATFVIGMDAIGTSRHVRDLFKRMTADGLVRLRKCLTLFDKLSAFQQADMFVWPVMSVQSGFTLQLAAATSCPGAMFSEVTYGAPVFSDRALMSADVNDVTLLSDAGKQITPNFQDMYNQLLIALQHPEAIYNMQLEAHKFASVYRAGFTHTIQTLMETD